MIDPKEILTSLSDRFATSGKVQTVFGEPFESQGKTIITVARVKYGVGAGGGGELKKDNEDSIGGAGGGGGVCVQPMGVIEITEAGTRFIRFFDPKLVARLVGAGVVLGLLLQRALRGRK